LSALQTVLGVTRSYPLAVGLAAIDDNPLGPNVPIERLAQKSLGSSGVVPRAEPEFDRILITVDGSMEIFPLPSDFDVSLTDVPFPADTSLAKIEALDQPRRVANNLSVNGRMID